MYLYHEDHSTGRTHRQLKCGVKPTCSTFEITFRNDSVFFLLFFSFFEEVEVILGGSSWGRPTALLHSSQVGRPTLLLLISGTNCLSLYKNMPCYVHINLNQKRSPQATHHFTGGALIFDKQGWKSSSWSCYPAREPLRPPSRPAWASHLVKLVKTAEMFQTADQTMAQTNGLEQNQRLALPVCDQLSG